MAVMQYQVPRLKVGEAAHLLGEDFEKVSVLDFNNIEIWEGTVKELKGKDDEQLSEIRECLVREIGDDGLVTKLIFLDETENPTMRTIDDFKKIDLYVVDMLKYLHNHDELVIMNSAGDELYKGRVEDLIWTKEGYLHELAIERISWFEACKDGSIAIYLEKGDK